MSLQIGTIKKIPIRLHFTLIIVFFLISWTLATGFMPMYYPSLNDSQYWIMGIVGAVILFISILLHELSHSLLSIRYGIRVHQIILFIFGGISEIKDETKDFKKEFKISVVGPLTSYALSGLFWILFITISYINDSAQNIGGYLTIIEGILLYSSMVNLIIGSFNLIPAFPLDGGRMLRAGLTKWKKDFDQATSIASKIGIAISFGIMGLGFVAIFRGSFVGGFWLIIIGWFLNSGAQTYLQQNELSNRLKGIKLKEIMNQNFIAVKPDLKISDLIANYFNVYWKSAFPVINDENQLVGMITTESVFKKDRMEIENKKVEDLMIPASEVIVMSEDKEVNDALMQLFRKGMSRIFILNHQSQLIGLVSKTDILNIAQERGEFLRTTKKWNY
ncbi:MAG TPA: site-2 protease family protein [Nitrososphaeraceae archaeon]|jgi:Zn-dependent protease|nr:site-2 protease family protein [Nitrososphaeraceae archaeon]